MDNTPISDTTIILLTGDLVCDHVDPEQCGGCQALKRLTREAINMTNSDDKFDFTDEEPTTPMAARVSTVDDLRAAYERERVLDPCDRPTKDLKIKIGKLS